MALLYASSVKTGGSQLVQLNNGYYVWIKKWGQGPIPLLLLHGGPGCTHEYLECFEDFIPKDKFHVYYYDQLGSKYSDQPDDPSLWTVERFCDEVEEVRSALGLESFYLYGHSWGGMLAIEYALKYKKHLKGLILSNTPSSMPSYQHHLTLLREQLPLQTQDLLKKYEDQSAFFHPEYQKILYQELYSKYLCKVQPWPNPILRAFKNINHQVYLTMQGPNEFIITGNLKEWDRFKDLNRITCPTLLLNGREDTVDPQHVIEMAKEIPQAEVYICEEGSHLAMYDDQDNYFKELLKFILS